MTDRGSLLIAEGVHKHYGGVRALRGASLCIEAGEIHGLVGENGSGKSTFLKILSGQILPDRATIHLSGEELPLGDPTRALAAGIATVTQETTLVPQLSVAENILLGHRKVRRWYGIDWTASARRALEILERLGLDIDAQTVVARLRPDEQQMVELARAISMDARVLILDEPTSSLTDEEVEALYQVTRTLREHGVATIFVSHRMKEILDLTDRVTVLRDGETVASLPTAEVDPDGLIELMVGRRLERLASPPEHVVDSDRPRLRVRDLSVHGVVHGAALDVGEGEIVGLAGLVGAGRSELLKALFGLFPDAGGSIEVDGQPVSARTPTDAMRSGIAYVPGDRKQFGLVLDMTVRENLLMARTSGTARVRRPPRREEVAASRAAIGAFHVKGVASDKDRVASLSGGNQQKVVLAKWMGTDPKVLLLDEPTRGVDVGAKGEIYRLLEGVRETGVSVLVSSSETPELLRLCDRVLVMFRGRIAASLPRRDASEARIAHYATGHQ